MTAPILSEPGQAPSLLRRMMAILYDSLLLFGSLMFVTLPWVIILNGPPNTALLHVLYQLYLLIICYLFFAWFWTHGGQTLGMRAWRIRVVSQNGAKLNWLQALHRFVYAILSWLVLGLGFWWVLISRDKHAWHDSFSGTHLVVLPKNKNSP